MNPISLWNAISKRDVDYPALERDIEVDVAIIGGGITGITAANQLIKAGKKVAVIEAYTVGSGTTGNSTGNLYVAVGPSYQKIVEKFDFSTAKIIAHSRQFAIDIIEKNIQEYGISCQFFRRPWYAYTSVDNDSLLEKEIQLYKEMGFSIDYISELPLSIKVKKAAVMVDQARFNPMQYVISMASMLSSKGCLIFENTRVVNMDEKEFCTLQTDHGKVVAKKVFIATHTPIGMNTTQFFIAPYRSYVVSATLKDNFYPEGHFWEFGGKSPILCTHPMSSNEPELLMASGSHHKTGQGSHMSEHFEKNENFLRRHFKVSEITYKWSAQHYQSSDSIPYIGMASKTSKHTYMASGFWADGLTYGTLAGILVSDLILEKNNSLDIPYKPNRRKTMASAPSFIKENFNVFIQYLKDYPIFSSEKFSNIKIGEGKVVEIDREKCAVSRDAQNNLHIVSAICTHMKCVVNWNDAEKTWDCPCHGSRFTCSGKVIEGPAVLDLETKNRQDLL
ncbi:MAG: FAD-dependent oxidoreductase [Legionella sp.]|nr:FAD-dependent oxidoreductase [Legionella sp.]